VPSVLLELTQNVTLTPIKALGIPIALVGAVFLAIGAQLQHRGVVKMDNASTRQASTGLSIPQLFALLRRPSWVFGTLLLGLAVLFQLGSLSLSPLVLVQPLGAIALVITAIVNARVSKVKLTHHSIRAIAFCIVGVALFVTTAAFTTTSQPITQVQLFIVLAILAVIAVVFALAFAFLRKRFKALIYILAAGVLYGFVATLAKVVIDRIKTGDFEWLTLTCLVALLIATAVGGYFVQTAYSSGPPDLVIAGLTVIDPIVAVCIGVVVLQEAAEAPLWAVFVFLIAGALAIFGVVQLSRTHPQTQH
jgi:drug/metabolite transporter (DMT)-like permease